MTTRINFTQRALFEYGLSRVYKDEVKTLPKQYKGWLREEKATAFYETSFDVSDLGTMPEKTIGGSIELDQIYEGDQKVHALKTYALALVIVYEVLRWDLYGVFPRLMNRLAKSATTRYNLVSFAILNNSFSTADANYTDLRGEALFGSTKTRLDGGTWDNAGTIGLSYTGVQQGKIDLTKQVNERGIFIDPSPDKLICSTEQRWIADTILQSSKRPGTADNDANTVRGAFTPFDSPYLTNQTYWWLWSKADADVCLRMGDPPELRFDGDIRTMDRVGMAYCSFFVKVDKARGCWGSTGGA